MARLLASAAVPIIIAALVSRVGNPLTFSGRGIPPGGVAPPSNIPDILGRRALPVGRRAPENLSPDFQLGTLGLRPQAPADTGATLFERSQAAPDDARLPDPLYPAVIALWQADKPANALTALERQVGSTDGGPPLEATILRARLLSAAGRDRESAELWDDIRNRASSLAAMALRAQVDSRVRAGELDRAEQLLAKQPNAAFGDLVAMVASGYRAAGRLDRAIALYRRAIATPVSGAVGDEASLGLAATLEQSGDPRAALALLRDLQLRFRQPATFGQARAQLQRLATALNRTVEPYTERQYQALTDRLRDFSAYDEALAVLEDWKQTYSASTARIDALIVDTLYRARLDEEADARAAAFLKSYPDSAYVPDIRVLQYRLDVREGRTDGVRSRGRDLWNGRVQGVSLADRFSLGRLLAAYLVSVGEISEGLEVYEQLSRANPSLDMRIDVLWRSSVAAIRTDRLDRAESTLRTLRGVNPGPDTSAIADYWTAVIHERRNRRNDAIQLLTRLVRRLPYDYYGIRARERLAALNAPLPLPQPDSRLSFPSLLLQQTSRGQTAFRGAELLARAGLKAEAAELARNLATALPNDPALALLAARASADAGEPRQTVRLVEARFGAFLERPADGVPSDFWTLAYPRAFWEDIRPAAESAQIDPLLLLSLARQESRFDRSVRSAAGALGLFQIMPYTADRLAATVGIPVADRSVLLQPRVSAAYAARLVSDLLKAFDGDPVAVVAAYNAGEDRTREWWKNARGVTEDLFVDMIPYTETRTYVRTVYTNLVRYRQIYK